ncbi:H(+)-transporting V1 sector ATPase subunit G [Irineochytrium annulatum]|nr:H(+)-transporting V1 sector ATPase subunit G [Irineochytrium annulatum]
MSSAGIQTLLEAEKEASKIVTKARQYRVQRLKDARTEAAKEIEVLKQEKNREFANYETQYSGSTTEGFGKIDAETDQRLVEINELYRKNKAQVIEKLLKCVVEVEPKVLVLAQRLAGADIVL